MTIRNTRNLGEAIIHFKGSTEGGDEIVEIPYPSKGALIICTSGFDYGSWIAGCFSLPEEAYQSFLSMRSGQVEQSSQYAFDWLCRNCADHQLKEGKQL